MPTGDYLGKKAQKWFQEAYRLLNTGGYTYVVWIDNILLLLLLNLAGFQEQQSIYWYYISNFPKATDLIKMIDKNAGASRSWNKGRLAPMFSGSGRRRK